jgi:hypothetical protein
MSFLSDDRLTPGIIDGAAEHAFSTGACAALAYAMHEATGWTIIGISDAHNVHDGRLGGGSSLHWGVMRPDGKFIDIDGVHEIEDIVERYMYDADDEEAAWGKGTPADINEWYVENQGAPISLSLARTFVDPLLNRITTQEAFPQP